MTLTKLSQPSTYSSNDLTSGGKEKIRGIIQGIGIKIETAFTTIRHRTKRSQRCLTLDGMLHIIFKLGQCAKQNRGASILLCVGLFFCAVEVLDRLAYQIYDSHRSTFWPFVERCVEWQGNIQMNEPFVISISFELFRGVCNDADWDICTRSRKAIPCT